MGEQVRAEVRNRIVGEGQEAPDALLPNPENWRVHPATQQDALEAVLERVGWVQSVIVNKRTGYLVDGHMRVALALRRGEALVPVTYVDLDPEEERLVLATLDPVAAMAGTDRDMLESLLAGLGDAEDAGLAGLLDSVRALEGLDLPGAPDLRNVAAGAGNGGPEDLWPVIKIKLSPEADEALHLAMKKAGGTENTAVLAICRAYLGLA